MIRVQVSCRLIITHPETALAILVYSDRLRSKLSQGRRLPEACMYQAVKRVTAWAIQVCHPGLSYKSLQVS